MTRTTNLLCKSNGVLTKGLLKHNGNLEYWPVKFIYSKWWVNKCIYTCHRILSKQLETKIINTYPYANKHVIQSMCRSKYVDQFTFRTQVIIKLIGHRKEVELLNLSGYQRHWHLWDLLGGFPQAKSQSPRKCTRLCKRKKVNKGASTYYKNCELGFWIQNCFMVYHIMRTYDIKFTGGGRRVMTITAIPRIYS